MQGLVFAGCENLRPATTHQNNTAAKTPFYLLGQWSHGKSAQ